MGVGLRGVTIGLFVGIGVTCGAAGVGLREITMSPFVGVGASTRVGISTGGGGFVVVVSVDDTGGGDSVVAVAVTDIFAVGAAVNDTGRVGEIVGGRVGISVGTVVGVIAILLDFALV